LLTLCQSAAATAPVAVPQAIVGNNDETAILLLALANDAGDELARRAPGGWVSMIREFNFQSVAVLPQHGTVANVGNSAVISGLSGIELVSPDLWIAAGTGIPNNAIIRLVEPPITMSTPTPNKITLSLKSSVTGAGTFQFGQANYPLPADFDRPVDNTFWDRSRYWAMRGPLSPQQWQIYKSSVIGRASIQRRFRFRSVYSQGGTQVGGSIGTEGVGDVPAFRTFLSIDPTPFDDGAQFVFEYVSAGWCQSMDGIPQNSWRADTDVSVDPTFEYLIRLSLKYRLLRRLGLSYNEELDEYERQVSKALATDGGAPILNMTPMDGLHLIGPFQLPETGYGPQTGQP
jgi:hypothetical protein